jgi:hypothetical protein
MVELAIITPSYAPDFQLCRDLNASILRHASSSTIHYIIVPNRDMRLFSTLSGPRTCVWSVDELLPRHIMGFPRSNVWINARRLSLPIRGWVMQQVTKLQAAAQIDADVLLSVDSDVIFVRPVTAETFRLGGRICFYRKEAAITEELPRHVIWHDVSRKLLGLPSAQPPLSDYIHSPNVWDHQIILALQQRIQETTGRPWLDVVASQMHVSECTLYGVFVDEVLGARAHVAPVASMRCHNYWEGSPLSMDAADRFIDALPVSDVAIMISAKSRTPLKVRRAALSKL